VRGEFDGELTLPALAGGLLHVIPRGVSGVCS
jgi:hypothetical protein